MSSYVFQFCCGPEGIALANPGRARTRPALAGPPPRATAELVFEDPVRPAARLRSASASAEQERPRRARDIMPTTTADQDRRQATGDGIGIAAVRLANSQWQGGQHLLQTGLRAAMASTGAKATATNPCCASSHVSGACSSFPAQATSSATVSVQTGNASLSQLGNAPILDEGHRLYSRKGHSRRRGQILVHSSKVFVATKDSGPTRRGHRQSLLVPLDIMNRKLHLLGNLSPLHRCKQPSSWPKASSRSKLCSKMS